MPTETFLIILVVFLLIFGTLAIVFLVQIHKTFSNINISIQTLNQHLPVILKNLEDISTDVKGISGHVNKQVEGFAIPILRLQTLLLNAVLSLENALQFPVFKATRNFRALSKGLQVFARTLRSKDGAGK